jgi:hypothetical protein
LERAKQIKEERKNAVNDSDTFRPQLVARQGSSGNLTQALKQQDSLDQLTSEVRKQLNDPMDLPLPALVNKAKQNANFGGRNDDDIHPSLPSPGSDALGKEVKKFGGNSNPFQASDGSSHNTNNNRNRNRNQGQANPFQSKFMQQYEEENDQVFSNLAGGNGNQRHHQPPQQQPQQQQLQQQQQPQKNPDDDFMNLLRGNGNTGSKNKTGGWNDDTTVTNGFDNFKSTPSKKPPNSRRNISDNSTPTTSSTSKSSVGGNSTGYLENYNHSRQQSQYDLPPKVSPRSAPAGDFHRTDGPPRQSPRDPVVKEARSSLSLLKSKIKLSESFNSSKTLKKNDMVFDNSNNDHEYDNSGNHRGHSLNNNHSSSNIRNMSSNSSSFNQMTSRSAGGSSRTASTSESGDSDYYSNRDPQSSRTVQSAKSVGGGYEPSIAQNRAPAGNNPVPKRSNSGQHLQYHNDDSDEENVVVMVPKQSKNNSNQQSNGMNNRNQFQQQQPQQYEDPPRTQPRTQKQQPQQQQQQQQQQYQPPSNSYYPPPEEFDDGAMDVNAGPQCECPDCGRKFNEKAFEKHVKICAKVFLQKRKKFDSTKQRIAGEGADPELKKYVLEKRKEEAKAKKSGVAPNKTDNDNRPVEGAGGLPKWKQQSKGFREAMKQAREYTKAKESGAPLPPPVASAPDPSLIPCPHCGRRFNEKAADRHIPQCSNIKAKPSVLKRGSGITAAQGTSKGKKY